MNLPTIHRTLRSVVLLAAFAGIALFAHAQSNYFVESGKTIARIGGERPAIPPCLSLSLG
jgi:hypothetical protein